MKPYVLVRSAVVEGQIKVSRVRTFSTLCDLEYWAKDCHSLIFVKDSSIFGGYYRNPSNGSTFEIQANSK